MKLTQRKLAKEAGVTQQMISQILSGKARPSWKTAKRLAKATSSPPILWMEGSPEQLKAAVKKIDTDKLLILA